MNDLCECQAAGFCKRHGVKKTNREYELCAGVNCSTNQNMRYWNAWEQGKMPNQAAVPEAPELIVPDPRPRGLGDTVAGVIRRTTGIKPCGGCKNREALLNQWFPYEKKPVEPHVFSNPKRNLLFHIWPVKGYDAWKWNCDQLLARADLWNGKRVVAIVQDGSSEHPDQVKEYLRDFTDQFIVATNKPKLREVVTFVPLLERVESTDPNEVTFFCHSKCVRHNLNSIEQGSTIFKWTRAMWDLLCNDWAPIESLLRTHACVGTFKRYGQFRTRWNHQWHYSGTFYWFRHDVAFTRNWRYIDKKFFGAESWPGHMFKPEEAAAILFDGIDDLYKYDYWMRDIEPALTSWRKERGLA